MDDNIHNLRDALKWLDRRIREEAECDGEMTNEHAIQLGFITNMLEKFPLRQCDVGTAEEQAKRFSFFCMRYHGCGKCDLNKRRKDCKFAWGQMPYAEEEGAGE